MARGGLGGVARKVQCIASGDGPDALAFTITKAGTGTADVIGAYEKLVVQSFELVTATGGAVEINGGGTGAIICRGTIGTSGGGIANSSLERHCYKGQTPTLSAADGGQTDAILEGVIVKGMP